MNLPRVTEILRATESQADRDRLRKWQQKMDKAHGGGTAEEIGRDAREKGTQFHTAIEEYFKFQTMPDFSDPTEQARWRNAFPWLRIIAKDYIALEMEVISQKYKYKYVGHLDCLAWGTDGVTVVDWKTSKRVKKKAWINDYFLQVTAYSLAVNEMTEYQDKPVEECQIYIFSPTKTQVFTCQVKDYQDEWLERLQAYQRLKEFA